MLAVPFVFGIDSFIAGDSNGAIAKFISTIIPIFWPILIIWKIVDLVRAYFFPEGVFTYGTFRMFPWSWIMES